MASVATFNKSHFLSFMDLNLIFWEGVHRFHQTVKGIHGKNRLLAHVLVAQDMEGILDMQTWLPFSLQMNSF